MGKCCLFFVKEEALDEKLYQGKFFSWGNVKDNRLETPGDISWQECKQKCDDNQECSAWERCYPAGTGCSGCYLFKNFTNQPVVTNNENQYAETKQEQLTPQLGSTKTSDGYCTNEASKNKINNFIECEKSCMDDNTCKGFAYLPGSNRQCIKSNDNCTNTSQHPDFKWVSFNMNKPTMCTIPQTTWINSKMGGDTNWTQAQGEGAQKCKVPSNLQSRITN